MAAGEVRVLVVDDEELVRVALRAILEAQPGIAVVAEAGTGEEAVRLAGELRPDVVLMDVRMPGVDGIEATRRIVSEPAGPPRVLVLTTFENDGYVYRALRAGAHGFLLKRAEAAEITQAVRLAAVGDTLMYPAAIRRLVNGHRADGGVARTAGLSEREAEVLRLMCRGLSNGEIAQRLRLSTARSAATSRRSWPSCPSGTARRP